MKRSSIRRQFRYRRNFSITYDRDKKSNVYKRFHDTDEESEINISSVIQQLIAKETTDKRERRRSLIKKLCFRIWSCQELISITWRRSCFWGPSFLFLPTLRRPEHERTTIIRKRTHFSDHVWKDCMIEYHVHELFVFDLRRFCEDRNTKSWSAATAIMLYIYIFIEARNSFWCREKVASPHFWYSVHNAITTSSTCHSYDWDFNVAFFWWCKTFVSLRWQFSDLFLIILWRMKRFHVSFDMICLSWRLLNIG